MVMYSDTHEFKWKKSSFVNIILFYFYLLYKIKLIKQLKFLSDQIKLN